MNLPPLSHFYRKKIALHNRGVGRFHLHDLVQWLGHSGKIVEIVRYGMYPKQHHTLRARGYCREYESYIVEDDRGKRWWPRVGNLHLVKRKEEKIK